jgi:hypothetical protein
MISRAREIAQMMGYTTMESVMEAIGRGELILLKVPAEQQMELASWLRSQVPATRSEDEDLADVIDDIADGLDLAMELTRYPADTDVCDLDLPHGWPSYCDKAALT